MIAPALAPATFTHFVTGFVGWRANPISAPASPRPLTPPPRKTPSASVIQPPMSVVLSARIDPLPSSSADGRPGLGLGADAREDAERRPADRELVELRVHAPEVVEAVLVARVDLDAAHRQRLA